MSSYYADQFEGWIYGDPHINSLAERRCTTCRGSGMDRDEADCIDCEGFGTIPLDD